MRALAALGLAIALCAGSAPLAPAQAQQAKQEAARRAPLPNVPRGEGERCIADAAIMRRDHMAMLKHQRDVTVHQGDRAASVKLTACIACHAVRGADGKPVSYAEPQHFCRSCHDYAAVSIDCFECHASKPEAKPNTAKANDAELAALSDYLRREQP